MAKENAILPVLALGGIALLFLKSGKAADQVHNDLTAVTKTPSYPNPSGSSRGLKNNNPGNIRQSSTVYNGEILPSGDPAFKQFQTMADGYEAIFSLLYAYELAGFNTISTIINRYAPSSDNNNTQAYINFVSTAAGLDPNQEVGYSNPQDIVDIVTAIGTEEDGTPANNDDVMAGYNQFQAVYPQAA